MRKGSLITLFGSALVVFSFSLGGVIHLKHEFAALGSQVGGAVRTFVPQAQAEGPDSMTIVLRLTADKDVETLLGVIPSSVEDVLSESEDHAEELYTKVFYPKDPLYKLAREALGDIMSNETEARPQSVAELIDKVSSTNDWVFATRWPQQQLAQVH